MSKKAVTGLNEPPKKTAKQLIFELEKAKEALTQAQKDLEDGKFKDACDCIFASKLYTESVVKAARSLWEDAR